MPDSRDKKGCADRTAGEVAGALDRPFLEQVETKGRPIPGRPFSCPKGAGMADDDEYSDEAAEVDVDPEPGLGELPDCDDDSSGCLVPGPADGGGN